MPSLFDGQSVPDFSVATGFAGGRIERQVEARTADTLPAALGHAGARGVLFQGDKAIVKGAPRATAYFTAAEMRGMGAIADATILLGYEDDVPVLAGLLPAEATFDADAARAVDLRSLAVEGAVPAHEMGALALGRSLTSWHLRHGFCANCGARTNIALGGFRRDCPACGTQHFPRTDPVAIMLAIRGESCLLGRSPRFPAAFYSCLAGFVEPGETIEAAVRREIAEESAVIVGRVRYYASQPWPFPSSLMIGCHAEALTEEVRWDEAELSDCRWFPRDEVLAMIAGTHAEGLFIPPSFAIAHHLIRAWAEGD